MEKKMQDIILFGIAMESIMQRRVKLIGDKETTYTGYPAQMLKEVTKRFYELKDNRRKEYKKEWMKKHRKQFKSN